MVSLFCYKHKATVSIFETKIQEPTECHGQTFRKPPENRSRAGPPPAGRPFGPAGQQENQQDGLSALQDDDLFTQDDSTPLQDDNSLAQEAYPPRRTLFF
jgi:hypothetical protein